MEIRKDGGRSWLKWHLGSGKLTAEIDDIHVDAELRRRGTGRAMVHEVLELLPRECLLLYAITRTDNVAAQQFYEAVGFRIVGRLHNFYRRREEMVDGSSGFSNALVYGYDV